MTLSASVVPPHNGASCDEDADRDGKERGSSRENIDPHGISCEALHVSRRVRRAAHKVKGADPAPEDQRPCSALSWGIRPDDAPRMADGFDHPAPRCIGHVALGMALGMAVDQVPGVSARRVEHRQALDVERRTHHLMRSRACRPSGTKRPGRHAAAGATGHVRCQPASSASTEYSAPRTHLRASSSLSKSSIVSTPQPLPVTPTQR